MTAEPRNLKHKTPGAGCHVVIYITPGCKFGRHIRRFRVADEARKYASKLNRNLAVNDPKGGGEPVDFYYVETIVGNHGTRNFEE